MMHASTRPEGLGLLRKAQELVCFSWMRRLYDIDLYTCRSTRYTYIQHIRIHIDIFYTETRNKDRGTQFMRPDFLRRRNVEQRRGFSTVLLLPIGRPSTSIIVIACQR